MSELIWRTLNLRFLARWSIGGVTFCLRTLGHQVGDHVMKINKKKHCQRHNGPRILSPKLELSQKAETNANSNVDFFPRYYFLVYLISTLKTIVIIINNIIIFMFIAKDCASLLRDLEFGCSLTSSLSTR